MTSIIFVNRNNSMFLLTALLEAKKSNPNSVIYLIGDESNKHYDFVSHIDYRDLIDRDYEEFAENYRHLSTTGYEYELFCFLRWFLIKNLIKRYKIKNCFYADSDVLISQELGALLEPYSHYDLIINEGSAHNCYIKNYDAISNFCEFVSSKYSKAHVHELEDLYSKHSGPGGICDMTLWGQYEEASEKATRFSKLFHLKFFDHNLSESQGFEMNPKVNFKNIKKKNGKIVCKLLATGDDIEFVTVHFQGNKKKFMKKFASINILGFLAMQLKYNPKLFLAAIFKQIYKKFKI